MKQFQWSRIALITQSENIFTFVSWGFPSTYTYACIIATFECMLTNTYIHVCSCLAMFYFLFPLKYVHIFVYVATYTYIDCCKA